ncbi:threonine-phosphate decarboxylase [Paenibacillus swuensis]|uniref:threonine-phosphate decarboxylase n=1 Tax=Paenibacillus swuensis TaxID=1178515 RepID=A0A172TH39_9BACL|nr:threonine-phosphate decarboxylase CobD [Paenibacillus swuensis]ANE46365.1 threonine-phosphate decarboxylase [Paenibacillus swuensis]
MSRNTGIVSTNTQGNLETYGHGGDRDTAAALFGYKPNQMLDFSANINPLGTPVQVLEALVNGLPEILHYPDPAHRNFRRKLAARLGVDPEELVVGNGAAECMALALLGLDVRAVGIAAPCFSEYASLAEQFGSRVITVTGKAERDFRPTLDELLALLEQADLVFLGHPNNPTGSTYPLEELRALADRAEAVGSYLVLDEAFVDFIPPEERVTLLSELSKYTRLIIIHSMTKFYGIPGLRLGYAIAHRSVAERMRGKQVTWSVNALALLAGEGCLDPSLAEFEQSTRALVHRERKRLVKALQAPDLGWTVWPSAANFLLVRLPEPWTAAELQSAMGLRGIMIRNCAMYEGLTPHDFRIAVRGPADNDRLLTALRAFAQERKGSSL